MAHRTAAHALLALALAGFAPAFGQTPAGDEPVVQGRKVSVWLKALTAEGRLSGVILISLFCSSRRPLYAHHTSLGTGTESLRAMKR